MKKATSVYLHYLLYLVLGFNAVNVAAQNEIVFPSDSVWKKNPYYLFSLIDKGNDVLEAKYISYLGCTIKAPDEKIVTGEIYGADKKIIKYSNKLIALIIQQFNNKGERIGETKIIKIALRPLTPTVEYTIKPRIDSDISILGTNLKVDYGQNNYETIPELNADEIAQLKEIYTTLYKKGSFKKYYLESAKINKLEATEKTEASFDTKSLKFGKNEKLIKTKEIAEDEVFYFTQTKKSEIPKGKLFKIYIRKDTATTASIIDSLFFAEETNAELEEIEYVHDVALNKNSGLFLQFRNLSKTNKGFEFVYLGFDNKLKRLPFKQEENKIKNFIVKSVYKDLDDLIIVNFNSAALTKGVHRIHVFSKDSIYQSFSLDATDTVTIKEFSADENSWKNDDGYNSKIVFSKKINSTTILLEQTDLLETSSGMISSNGYIPNNFNRGYCHTNMYFIKDNKILKKYILYSDYFNLKPIDYSRVFEENGESAYLLEAKNSIFLKFNDTEILNYKTIESSNQYLFKLPVTKKYYFDFQKEKYYYYNDPTTNKIFIKKI